MATLKSQQDLGILKQDWPQVKTELRIGGLRMAIALIKTEAGKIFEATGAKSWLPFCSYREKSSLLRLLWEDQKNCLAHFTFICDCCNSEEKGQLKKQFYKRVATTTKALSFAANLITSKFPSFLAPKNRPCIPQKDEKILRDVPSKVAAFSSYFGMGNAIDAGKKTVLGWLGIGKKK